MLFFPSLKWSIKLYQPAQRLSFSCKIFKAQLGSKAKERLGFKSWLKKTFRLKLSRGSAWI